MHQRCGVLWACVIAGLVVSLRPGVAAEPVVTTEVLRDWSFTAVDAGAGEHPVAQLADGAIVVGQAGGLLRFDGHRMLPTGGSLGPSPVKLLLTDRAGSLHMVLADGTHTASNPEGSRLVADATPPPDLPGGELPEPLSICEAGDGSIWVGYRQGLVSRTTGLRRSWHAIPSAASDSADRSGYLAADTAGRVWLAWRTRLAVWSGSDWRIERHLPDAQTIIAAARDGGLWIRLGDRVHHFNGSRLTQPFDADVLTIRGLVEDREGRLWIATTRYGLVMWDGTRLATAETASSSIYSVFIDREGGVWAGSTAGLERGRPRMVQRVEMPTIKGLRAIRCDARDRLWFLTLDGEVGSQPGPLGPWLRSGGRGTDATVFHSRLDGWRYGRVTAITVAADDTVWLGTRDGGIVRIDQSQAGRSENLATPPDLRGRPVTALVALADGLLVAIGTSLLWNHGDRWHSLEWPAGHSAAEVTLMVADGRAAAWLATVAGGLYRVTIEAAGDGPATPLLRPVAAPRSGFSAPITSIVPLPDGSVWIATRGDGLWRFRAGEWSQLGAAKGLPAESLLAVVPDGRGRFWCATPRLFFAALIDELSAVAADRSGRCHCWVVTRDDRTAYFDPAVVPPDIATSDHQGTVLVALPTGVAACLTDRLPSGRPPPPVRVRSVRVDGQPLPSPGPVNQIPADPRLVEILLDEPILATPSNAQLEHQLTGIDADWVETPPGRRLVYERLPAGRHPLRLRSSSDAGTWVESAACVLEVAPTWWERPAVRWGVLVAVALTTAAATLSVRSRKAAARLERLREQAALDRERMRIARDMHDELGTSLTQISLLADLAGRKAPAETAASLTHISRIAHDTVAAFDEIVWAVNPEHDTLQHLLGYMALSASQTLGSLGIECRFDMPEHVPPRTAPAEFRRGVLLVVKEAITNVVKHAAARSVSIRWRVAGERLTIVIADDGRGTASEGQSRNRPPLGRESMRCRAEVLGGSCSVTAGASGGTQVTLELPLPADELTGSEERRRLEISHAT